MSTQEQLQKIAREILHCPWCRRGGTGQPVPGEGSGELPIVFVGEAPGRREAETGRPFVGRAGRFLRSMIGEIGLDENRVFLTSPVHYLPVRGAPSPAMIRHGRVHLLKQLSVIKPVLTVLLGNTACRALLDKNVSVSKEHGTLVVKDGARYFISLHPSYAARFPEAKKIFILDFALLKERAKNLSALP